VPGARRRLARFAQTGVVRRLSMRAGRAVRWERRMDTPAVARRGGWRGAAVDPGALPAAEGCIHQILGWREYMRGIYATRMPAYAAAAATPRWRRPAAGGAPMPAVTTVTASANGWAAARVLPVAAPRPRLPSTESSPSHDNLPLPGAHGALAALWHPEPA
jgi:hypothetical protein